MTPAAAPEAAGPESGIRGTLARLDAFQQRHRTTAVVAATVAKYAEDGAGRLADLLAYAAFLSVFPLLLVLFTLVEVLLFGHPAVQKDVVDAALRQFPDVGDELRGNITGLSGRNAALLVVLFLWLVYGCLRLSRSAQAMMATVWGVPRSRLPSFGRWLPRAVGFLVVIGVGFVAGGALAGIGSFGGLGPASSVVGFAASLVVNVAMFWAGFAIILAAPDGRHALWRGAVVAGTGWTVLQFVDAQLVTHELRHYHTLYGTFATFIVLLWWFGIGTMITTFAAEIDVVVARHLWPRSLRRHDPDTTPDASSGDRTVDQSTSAGVAD
jgi:YihY family inner membrane protein